MKKILVLAGVALLSVGVQAQENKGRVGINTDTPQATLEVTPSTSNLKGTTNEGIIAPRLTKSRVANIATPVEGTLVYVTDVTYTGNKRVVAKIDSKGYYYYDGTEWVKTKGAQGPRGLQGVQGPRGLQGPAGAKGERGEAGPIGSMGPAGPRGLRGETGPAGPTGASGERGPRGFTGDRGPQGPSGVLSANNGVTYDSGSKTVSLDEQTRNAINNAYKLRLLRFNDVKKVGRKLFTGTSGQWWLGNDNRWRYEGLVVPVGKCKDGNFEALTSLAGRSIYFNLISGNNVETAVTMQYYNEVWDPVLESVEYMTPSSPWEFTFGGVLVDLLDSDGNLTTEWGQTKTIMISSYTPTPGTKVACAGQRNSIGVVMPAYQLWHYDE